MQDAIDRVFDVLDGIRTLTICFCRGFFIGISAVVKTITYVISALLK